MDSMRSLHSWLVVLSYLYLVESSSFSWIWSRRLSNLEQGWDSKCQNHTQSPPIGGASAGKRRAADVPAADQSGHGTEQGVRAKALIHLGDNQNWDHNLTSRDVRVWSALWKALKPTCLTQFFSETVLIEQKDN